MKLLLRPDGTGTGVYDDEVRDLLPGTLAVHRASNVEFVPEVQRWRATEVGTGQVLSEAVLRQTCLAEEKAQLERRIYGRD